MIVVRSERAAHRVMKGTIGYLEEELGLTVNREKNQVALIKEISFLGFQVLRGKIRVSTKAQAGSKDRVRELTRRNNPLSMYQVIHELNEYWRDWVGYFGMQEFKYLFRDLDARIRSRMRSMQLKNIEGTPEVPTDHDQGWIRPSRGAPRMGQDEPLEADEATTGTVCAEPGMVQSEGLRDCFLRQSLSGQHL